MAQIKSLKPGQIVYTISRNRMGNTVVKTISVHRCSIVEVHEDHVVASWNGNSARKYYRNEVSSWRISKPYVVEGFIGSRRLATREEISSAKESGRMQEGGDSIRIIPERAK